MAFKLLEVLAPFREYKTEGTLLVVNNVIGSLAFSDLGAIFQAGANLFILGLSAYKFFDYRRKRLAERNESKSATDDNQKEDNLEGH